MFWRMAGLSTVSPVEAILDKDNFSLEELLDDDEIIQECKALNGRLINFLRERAQMEQLLRYIVDEASEDAEKRRTFKLPFISCEIFTCEVDIILKTLVEDEELMKLLFSFLEPSQSHSTLLAGYFSKVVISLMLRKTVPFMNFVQAHQQIVRQLVDLIGITSIMEVLIRLIGAEEHMYSNYLDAMQWLEETDVLEMILDKFGSSDLPEVHANAAETLCAITRYVPPGLASVISSPSFVGRIFSQALEDSRPKSVLVHSLSVCISLLDPKRLTSGPYHVYRGQVTQVPLITANPEIVGGMLESIGALLKLLDVSSAENVLPTTYGKLCPPLGKHRLKIVEFISILLSIGGEVAEKELIRLGAIQHILDLFFEYPFNNFLHHHVENIVVSCLENTKTMLTEHVLQDCNLVLRLFGAEKQFTLATGPEKTTIPTEGRSPPRIGNIGHITRIANKLVYLGNNNNQIQALLQESSEWMDWQMNVLLKRNTMENVYQWACGRPTAMQDRYRDSDDEDFRDKDYDVAALASNLSQAFRYGIYNNDEGEEGHSSIERDDEDVYFDDESAEVVISSLRLGDEQDSGSLFSNSNWFAFEDDRMANEPASSSLNVEGTSVMSSSSDDEVIDGEDDEFVDTLSQVPESSSNSEDLVIVVLENAAADELITPDEGDKPTEWVQWRESSDPSDISELGDENPSSVLPDSAELGITSTNHELLDSAEPGYECSNSEPAGPAGLDNVSLSSEPSDPEDSKDGSPSPPEFGDANLSSDPDESIDRSSSPKESKSATLCDVTPSSGLSDSEECKDRSTSPNVSEPAELVDLEPSSDQSDPDESKDESPSPDLSDPADLGYAGPTSSPSDPKESKDDCPNDDLSDPSDTQKSKDVSADSGILDDTGMLETECHDGTTEDEKQVQDEGNN